MSAAELSHAQPDPAPHRATLAERFGGDPVMCPRCRSIEAHRAKTRQLSPRGVEPPAAVVERIKVNDRTTLSVAIVPRHDRTHVQLRHATRKRSGETVPGMSVTSVDARLLPALIAALQKVERMLASAVPISPGGRSNTHSGG